MRDLLILVLAMAGGILAAYAGDLISLGLVGCLLGLLLWGTLETKRGALVLLGIGLMTGFLRAEWYQRVTFNNKYYVNCTYLKKVGIHDQYLVHGAILEVSEYQARDQAAAASLLKSGQRVRLTGDFLKTPWTLNGVLFQGSQVRLHIVDGPPTVTESLNEWKLRLAQGMAEQFGRQEGALAASLVLGVIEEPVREKGNTLKFLGIIHILSISGFHVNLLEAILKRSGLRRVSLPLIFAYALLISSVPAWRAALMKTSRETGRWLHRDSDAFNQLLTAAFLLLLHKPWNLFSPSFLLTFGATLGLILLQAPLTHSLAWLPGGKLKEGMILSSSAMIPCIPTLSAMSFDVNLALFPANLILVPVYSLYCMGAFLSIPLLTLGLRMVLYPLGSFLGLFYRIMELLEYVMVEFLSLRVAWSGTLIFIWLWLEHDLIKQRAVSAKRRLAAVFLLYAVLHVMTVMPGTTKVIFHKQMGQARVVVQKDLRQYEFVTVKMNKKGVAGRAIAVESPLSKGELVLLPSRDLFPRLILAGAEVSPRADDSSDIINEEYLWIFGKWIRLK